MSSLEEIRRERIEKYERLKEEGIEPFPSFSGSDLTLEKAKDSFSKLAKTKKSIF